MDDIDKKLSIREALSTIKDTTTNAYNKAENAVKMGKHYTEQAQEAYSAAKKKKQQRHIMIIFQVI